MHCCPAKLSIACTTLQGASRKTHQDIEHSFGSLMNALNGLGENRTGFIGRVHMVIMVTLKQFRLWCANPKLAADHDYSATANSCRPCSDFRYSLLKINRSVIGFICVHVHLCSPLICPLNKQQRNHKGRNTCKTWFPERGSCWIWRHWPRPQAAVDDYGLLHKQSYTFGAIDI